MVHETYMKYHGKGLSGCSNKWKNKWKGEN